MNQNERGFHYPGGRADLDEMEASARPQHDDECDTAAATERIF